MRVDGGGANNDFLMQFQADILGIPVIRPKVTETTSLGAAYAAGFWKDLSELTERWRIDRVFKPKMQKPIRKRLYGRWKKAVRLALEWGKDGETEA
jgi:glycerol kinase